MKKSCHLLKKTFTDKLFAVKGKTRHALCLLTVLIYCSSLFSCEGGAAIHENRSAANSLPQLNPHDGISYITNVPLYFRFMDSDFLISKQMDIHVSSGKRVEEAIITALISAKGTDSVHTTVIPESTELVSMTENEGILYVTLSSSFADDNSYNAPNDKQLAVYQILCTLTAQSYNPVQLLIDKSGSGSGERVTYGELGIASGKLKAGEYTSPFVFDSNKLIKPDSFTEYTLSLLKDREFGKAAPLFTDSSTDRTITSYDLETLFSVRTIKEFEVVKKDSSDDLYPVECIISIGSFTGKNAEELHFNIQPVLQNSQYMIPFDEFSKDIGADK